MLLEHWIECLMARLLNALENLVRSVQVKYRKLMVAMVATEAKLLATSLIATMKLQVHISMFFPAEAGVPEFAVCFHRDGAVQCWPQS